MFSTKTAGSPYMWHSGTAATALPLMSSSLTEATVPGGSILRNSYFGWGSPILGHPAEVNRLFCHKIHWRQRDFLFFQFLALAPAATPCDTTAISTGHIRYPCGTRYYYCTVLFHKEKIHHHRFLPSVHVDYLVSKKS